MYKIKLRGIALPALIAVLGFALSFAGAYFSNYEIKIDLPLLLIGIATIYLLSNYFIYPKAAFGQVILIAVSGFGLFGFMNFLYYLTSSLIGIKKSVQLHNMPINPVFIAISVISCILVLFWLIKLEEVKSVAPLLQPAEDTADIKMKAPVPEEVSAIREEKIQEPKVQEQKLHSEEHVLSKIKHVDEPKLKIENINNEKTIDLFSAKEAEIKSEPAESLGFLPNISFEEKSEVPKQEEEIYFIPDNVRLVEKATPKKIEDISKISSIGKLLVNHKDIENIIEINELVKQAENDSDGSNIITKILGEKLKENLVKIQGEFPELNNSTISNKAGFTVASLIDDSSTQHTIGALASGAFMTLENYLVKINYETPSKIIFETTEDNHILVKIDNFIFYFNSSLEFEPVLTGELKELIKNESEEGIIEAYLKEIKGISDYLISNSNGKLEEVVIEETKDPQALVSVSTAVFENLKVFISNINEAKLNKMIIFSGEKVLTIRKSADKIITCLSSKDGPVQLSNKLLKIEELMQ